MSDETAAESPVTLTIDEACEKLGTNRTRLLRLLSRPEFTDLVSEQERETKTGTRKARVVAFASLGDLAIALAAKPERERIQKRKRERDHSEHEQGRNGQVFTFNGEAPASPSDHATMHAREREQYEARIAAQAEEIAFLRATLQREQESRLNEQRLLASEQQITARKMIEAMEQQPEQPDVVKKNGGSSGANDVRARMKLKVIEPCPIQIQQART